MKLKGRITIGLCCAALLALSGAAWSDSFSADSRKTTRIALVSDAHVTRGTNEDQALYRGRLEKVIAQVNAAKVNLVLIAGDLTQDGKPEEIADFKKQIQAFRAPVWCVPGNHDVGNKRTPGKEGGVAVERVAAFEKKLGPSFFAKERSGVRVVGINSPLLGSGLAHEKAMWDLLEKEFAKPATRPVLLLTHYPPFVKQPDEPGGEYWNMEPGPRRRLLDLLTHGRARAVLSGHLHRELVNRYEDILVVTTPPVSFGLPRGQQKQGWTLVTVPAHGEVQAEFRHIED